MPSFPPMSWISPTWSGIRRGAQRRLVARLAGQPACLERPGGVPGGRRLSGAGTSPPGIRPDPLPRCVYSAQRQLAALACDLLAFVDGLALQRPLLVGHDWGARAVASACGLREGFASHLVMLSVGYASNDPQQVLSCRRLVASGTSGSWPRHAASVRCARRARRSPGRCGTPGRRRDGMPSAISRRPPRPSPGRTGSPWCCTITGIAGASSRGAALRGGGTALAPGTAPGAADPGAARRRGCLHPDGSRGREHYFSGRYQRLVLEGVGHFPQREAANQVADAILRFCADD